MYTKQEEVLRGLYLNPSSPSSFTNAYKLYKEAKPLLPGLTLQKVKSWLSRLCVEQTHRQRPKKAYRRRKVLVLGLRSQLDTDLMDMSRFAAENNDYRYILISINVFSRKLMVVPLLNKTSSTVAKAMEVILKEMSIRKVRSDQGKEFTESDFQSLMKKHKINHFTTTDSGSKQTLPKG